MASSPEIPATSEVLLKSDASKQFLDSLLGQGWDAWGQGLGGSQAAELMLEMFSAFNIVALATISALFLWVLAVSVAGTAHEGTPFGKRYTGLRISGQVIRRQTSVVGAVSSADMRQHDGLCRQKGGKSAPCATPAAGHGGGSDRKAWACF